MPMRSSWPESGPMAEFRGRVFLLFEIDTQSLVPA